MKKNTHHNSTFQGISNSRSWVDFLDKESLLLFPAKDDWRKKLAFTMIKWAEKKSSLEIMEFCIEYKIPRRTLLEWVEKYEDIKQVYEDMKLILASHRRVGSMRRKLDGQYAYKDMHVLDPEWKAINKYHADLKKEEDQQKHIFVINDQKPHVITKEELKGQQDENI